MTKAAFATIVTLLLFVFVWPLAAQGVNERLVNGGFEDGTTGWDILVNGNLQSVTSPAPVRSGERSGLIVLGAGQNGGQIGQSITLDPDTPLGDYFTLAGWIYVPESETNINSVRVRIRYYATATCEQPTILENSPFIDISVQDEWIPFEFTAPLPDGYLCATPLLDVNRVDVNEPVNVYWDDLSFYDSGPTAVSFIAARTTTPANYTALGLLTAGLLILLSWPILTRRHQAATRLDTP